VISFLKRVTHGRPVNFLQVLTRINTSDGAVTGCCSVFKPAAKPRSLLWRLAGLKTGHYISIRSIQVEIPVMAADLYAHTEQSRQTSHGQDFILGAVGDDVAFPQQHDSLDFWNNFRDMMGHQ
jgi:hypothetical protein